MHKNLRHYLSAFVAMSTLLPGMALVTSESALACGSQECSYGQGCYSQGACRDEQRCSMDGTTPTWVSGCNGGC